MSTVMNLQLVIVFALCLGIINGTLLFYSNKNIQIPSLKYFNEDEFQSLLNKLDNPQIIAFQNDLATTDNIPKNLKNLYSSYVPNGNMYIQNVTTLGKNSSDNLNTITEIIDSFKNDLKNMLVIVSSPNTRSKRDTNATDTSDANDRIIKGPVLYSAGGNAMIYSSRPLILKTSTENYTLGYANSTTITRQSPFDVLAATINFLEKKPSITLKFRFQQQRGYWSLRTVQVNIGGKLTLLNVSNLIRAENNYSYHCFGKTTFKGDNMELILYEIQVQPYTKNGKFSSAYDCVPFTTVPIWSGLMVSFALIVGLFIGFGALASIKTMDKFDNSKTKQLSFTVSE